MFTACLMMVLPGIGGYFADKYLNTSVTFTIAGVIFGLVAGFVQILKIVNKADLSNKNPNDQNSGDQQSGDQNSGKPSSN